MGEGISEAAPSGMRKRDTPSGSLEGGFRRAGFDSDKRETLAGELVIGRVPVGVGGPRSLRKSS